MFARVCPKAGRRQVAVAALAFLICLQTVVVDGRVLDGRLSRSAWADALDASRNLPDNYELMAEYGPVLSNENLKELLSLRRTRKDAVAQQKKAPDWNSLGWSWG